MKHEAHKKQKGSPGVKAKAFTLPDSEHDNKFVFVALCAYAVMGLIGVFHHEMWRDELQTWLVGAASHSMGDFLHSMKGESNPFLWYTTNFLLSRFTGSPLIAQLAHFFISTGSAYLILKYAPFTKLQRVLLCFSYFVFFEYALIARGYAYTVFFIFLFCALYKTQSKNRYLILSGVLFLLANTTGVHGVIMAVSLAGFMVFDYFLSTDTSLKKKYTPVQLFIGLAIVLIGVYIAYSWIQPPADSDRSNKWFTAIDSQRLGFVFRTFWMSFLPVPNFSSVNFWNSNLFFQKDTSSATFGLLFIFSVALIIYSLSYYSRRLSLVLFALLSIGGVLLLTYSNNTIFAVFGARYYGFIFIAFVAAAWLAPLVHTTKKTLPFFQALRSRLKTDQYFSHLLTGLLAINTLAAAVAFGKDFSLPFTEIESTGEFITAHHLEKLPTVGYIDYAVSPISAFTRQPIYFPDRDTTGRFTTWGVSKFSFDPGVTFNRITRFIAKQKDSVLYISTGDYYGMGEKKELNNIVFTRLGVFTGGVVPDEYYTVYLAIREPGKNIPLNGGADLAVFNRGFQYYKDKDYDRAIVAWDSTLAINPNNLDACNNIGICYLNFKNNPEKARKYFERTISIDSNYASGYISLIAMAQQTNNTDLMLTYIHLGNLHGITIETLRTKGITIPNNVLQRLHSAR